jgi:hypothetical protein
VDIFDSVTVTGSINGEKRVQYYGKSLVDFDNDVEVQGGTYRELTIITIASPWKVRPSQTKRKRWWHWS